MTAAAPARTPIATLRRCFPNARSLSGSPAMSIDSGDIRLRATCDKREMEEEQEREEADNKKKRKKRDKAKVRNKSKTVTVKDDTVGVSHRETSNSIFNVIKLITVF